ncbi:hypothetical protein RHMOL_Rhmol02G0243000 [Rhododendron molle]|uniref:Uncharacterized protein n=1 Tax=Rhododendron molle TaxID=49168 RepID=A0ACC0PTQ9_RHOML|nr:hypothetical protein RHMOL_Rhmol02G0243000 [Rhododendron molle]
MRSGNVLLRARMFGRGIRRKILIDGPWLMAAPSFQRGYKWKERDEGSQKRWCLEDEMSSRLITVAATGGHRLELEAVSWKAGIVRIRMRWNRGIHG